jgi:histidine triad (HIT) family protein
VVYAQNLDGHPRVTAQVPAGNNPCIPGSFASFQIASFFRAPMTEDFYCDEALSGRTAVEKVIETSRVLAFHHTRPYWPVHIVVVPKRHISSLLALEEGDNELLIELFDVIKQIAARVTAQHGAARVLTNLGRYQDSKHLHFHINSGDPLR